MYIHTSEIVHKVSKWKFICQDIKYETSVTSLDVCFSCLTGWTSRSTDFSFWEYLALGATWEAAKDPRIWYVMLWTVNLTEKFYFSKALSQKDINMAYLPYRLKLQRHGNLLQSSWSDRKYNSFWKEGHQKSLRSDIVRKPNFPQKTKVPKKCKEILMNQAS